MNKFKTLAFILSLFNFFNTAKADDTAFGGSGSSPMPIEKNEIRMLDEHVIILGHDIDKKEMKGAWKISADFTFQNTSDKAITLDVGFPFPIYEAESNVTAPEGKSIKQGSPLIYDFNVRVDGKIVKALPRIISPNPEKDMNYKNAYIWRMYFSPHQTVNVHNEYIVGVTVNVLGYSFVSYVLKTGGLWQDGHIGAVKLEIIPNTTTRLCDELANNAADYLRPKPPDIKIEGDGNGRKYVWNLQNYHPNDDMDVCLQTGKDYVRYTLIHPLINNFNGQESQLNKMDKQSLRRLRNTIYAQYGRQFNTPEIQAYFNKQWWYQPNSNYSDNLLTKEDRQALVIIEKAEAK